MSECLFDCALFVTEIVLACRVNAGTGEKIHKNRPSHGVAYNTLGVKRYRFSDGNVIDVAQNEIIYLPKFSNYTVEEIEPGDCYAINFMLKNESEFKPFKCRIKHDTDRIANCFKTAEKHFILRDKFFSEICCKELYEIIVLLERNLYMYSYTTSKQRDIIKTATDYIAKNFSNGNIDVKTLSDMCDISEVYLRKIFKNEYGVSPVKYINNLRLNFAKSLILSGEYSITEACFDSGFNDTSYFSRTFKAKFGYSPEKLKHR